MLVGVGGIVVVGVVFSYDGEVGVGLVWSG